jgi:hypothetical protein
VWSAYSKKLKDSFSRASFQLSSFPLPLIKVGYVYRVRSVVTTLNTNTVSNNAKSTLLQSAEPKSLLRN